jgi:hypothetical protein
MAWCQEASGSGADSRVGNWLLRCVLCAIRQPTGMIRGCIRPNIARDRFRGNGDGGRALGRSRSKAAYIFSTVYRIQHPQMSPGATATSPETSSKPDAKRLGAFGEQVRFSTQTNGVSGEA